MNKIDHIRALAGMPEDEWRFWAKVDMTGDCWIWRSTINAMGYGVFRYHGKLHKAHRLAWRFVHGELLPADKIARHACDNPRCINPAHIVPGTHAENTADKIQRGRRRTARGRSHMTPAQVADARAAYAAGGVTQKQLAERYGITLRAMQAQLAPGRRG